MEAYIKNAKNINKIYKVTKILNFLVEIAVCIEKEIADEDVLKTFFQAIVYDYCDKFHDLIYSRREGNGHIERYKKLVELNYKWLVHQESVGMIR